MAKTICRCGGIKTNGRCDRCTSAKKKTNERGYSSRWQRYSQNFRRQWPFCADHERRGILVSIHPDDGCRQGAVDHIIRPQSEHDPLFWDGANHLGRCTSCHSVKTKQEENGSYNPIEDQRYRAEQLRRCDGNASEM